jgi:putative aldouronate transport system permease protein
MKIRSVADYLFQGIIIVLMLIVMFLVLYPIYYMIIVSLSNSADVIAGRVRFIPQGLNFKVYGTILNDSYFVRAYLNTAVITFLGTLTNIVMTSCCAYPLSRKDFYGRNIIMKVIVFTMFFSGGMVPAFILVVQLKLINSFWAIILPGSISVFNMIVMRTFFQGIPFELIEAAHADGANDLIIFARIIIPLSSPILATMILFYAVSHWNAFMSALLYLTDKNKFPIQLFIRTIVLAGETTSISFAQQASGSEASLVSEKSMQYAFVIAGALPVLVIYPFVCKYFKKGMMIGSLK